MCRRERRQWSLRSGSGRTGRRRSFRGTNLTLFAAWNPDEENPYGASVFRSMPFLVDVLLKIYSTIGTNWERAGNVRYSVVYKPQDEAGRIDAQERSEQIASQWSQAMQESRHGVVRDFVAVGDVEIKVIGADETDSRFGGAGTADPRAAGRRRRGFRRFCWGSTGRPPSG